MARSKESKSAEFYLAQIRKLKAENTALKKRLKSLERREHHFEHLDDEQESTTIENTPTVTCPECARGTMIELVIAGRCFSRCEVCGHRTRAKVVE